jgi:hypothetical protein
MNEIDTAPEDQPHRACPTCGGAVAFAAKHCGECGLPLPPPLGLRERPPLLVIVMASFVAMWIVGVILYVIYVEIPAAQWGEALKAHRYEQREAAPTPAALPTAP